MKTIEKQHSKALLRRKDVDAIIEHCAETIDDMVDELGIQILTVTGGQCPERAVVFDWLIEQIRKRK